MKMTDNGQSPSSGRPHRPDRPSLPSPGRVLTLVTQPTQDQLEDDGHSKETVKSFSICPDLADATTPVFAGPQGSLPAPPDSPSIKLPLPHGGIGIPTVREDPDASRLSKKSGSVRLAKNKKASKKNVGVVVADFNGLYPDELSIKVGEEIEIISKDTIVSRNIGWWTGRKGKGKFGIFPAACVSCDMQHGGGAENPTSSDYPLEIKNSEIDMKEVIGIGGFGKVYRAIYKGEDVAVKVAKTTTFDSLKAVQDVVSEAEKFAHLAWRRSRAGRRS